MAKTLNTTDDAFQAWLDAGRGPQEPWTVTQQQYDAALASYDKQFPNYRSYVRGAQDRQNLVNSLVVPPAAPPDLGDETVQQARRQMLRRMMQGAGAASAGMAGPLAPLAPSLIGS